MNSNIGRFISTDPVGPVNPATGKINQKLLLDPQRLNLYAYAGNNPYAYIDRFGLDWVLSQSTGRMIHINNTIGTVEDYGIVAYSGKGLGLNNPSMQNKINVGPIVEGTYTIGKMQDNIVNAGTSDEKILENSMRLTPDEETKAFIRELNRTGGFLFHAGEWKKMNSSKGCPAGMSIEMRETINESSDKTLKVVPQIDQDKWWYTKLFDSQIHGR